MASTQHTSSDASRTVNLRDVMRWFVTGVAVVATLEDDLPYAAAVNSLTSVSLDPPLILVCLRKGSRTGAAIARTGRFSVCVLAAQQEEHSRRFATSQPSSNDPALVLVDGLPVVKDALAGMTCDVDSAHPKGDHVIVVGRVVRTHHRHDEPLLFFNSAYHQVALDTPA